jgi:hypothetical protein
MRLGLLPGQQRVLDQAFKKARAFDRFRQRTRRTVLATAGGGLLLGVAAFFAGRSVVEAPVPQTTHPMDALALGDAQRLQARAIDLLAEVEMGRGTPSLWVGVERLILCAMLADDASPLRTRVLALRALPSLPPAIATALTKLASARPR